MAEAGADRAPLLPPADDAPRGSRVARVASVATVLATCAFLAGAMIYACIFGNVSQVIQSIDATGSRYRSQVENMNEFLRTHAMPTALQRRVRRARS